MKFFLHNRLFSVILIMGVLLGGLFVAPFDFGFFKEFRSPINVDAIPDLGENQQIIATEWMGEAQKTFRSR